MKTSKNYVNVRCLHTEHYITMGIEDAKELELEDGQVVSLNKSNKPKHPE